MTIWHINKYISPRIDDVNEDFSEYTICVVLKIVVQPEKNININIMPLAFEVDNIKWELIENRLKKAGESW